MADLGYLLYSSILPTLLYSNTGWPYNLVTGPDLLFLYICNKVYLKDTGFKEGFQNWI
jgi:hypothetical protein